MENYGNSADLEGHAALDDSLLGDELADVAGEVMADLPSMDEPFGPSKGEGTPESAQGKKPEQKEKQKQPELIKTVADLQAWFKKNELTNFGDAISFERDWKNSETGLHKGKTSIEFGYTYKPKMPIYYLGMPSGAISFIYGKDESSYGGDLMMIVYYPLNGEDLYIYSPTSTDIKDVLKIFNREVVAYETIQKNNIRREEQKKAKTIGKGSPKITQGKKPENVKENKERVISIDDLVDWYTNNVKDTERSGKVSYERDRKINETTHIKRKTTFSRKKDEVYSKFKVNMPSGSVSIIIDLNSSITVKYDEGSIPDAIHNEMLGKKKIENPSPKQLKDALKIFTKEIVACEMIQKR